MFESIAQIVLVLFVINLGIAFGAGLYESRIVVPQWLVYSPFAGYSWNADAARRADVGLKFWVFVTTLPLTLLTIASLIAVWWAPLDARNWWLGAIAATLVDRAMTFAYFIPTMIKLMQTDAFGQAEAVKRARKWVRLGYVRQAATLAAWLMAMMAFRLMHQ